MAYNPQLAVSTTYILPSGGLYATYHLLWEPETTIEVGNPTIDNLFGSLDVDSALSMPTRPMTFVFPFLIWERSEFATRCRLTRDFCLWKFGGTIHGNTYSTICICICISIVYIYIIDTFTLTFIAYLHIQISMHSKSKSIKPVTSGCTLNPAICTCHFRQVVGNVDWKMQYPDAVCMAYLPTFTTKSTELQDKYAIHWASEIGLEEVAFFVFKAALRHKIAPWSWHGCTKNGC